jgi:hypothetical protein
MDLFGLELKASVFEDVLREKFASDLPSQREAAIQLAKLGRMVRAYEKRFGWILGFVLSGPKRKVGKAEGECKRRVQQQDKNVDRLLRKVFEEQLVRDLAGTTHAKIGAKRVRGAVKKLVEKHNRRIHQIVEKRLTDAGLRVPKALRKTKD